MGFRDEVESSGSARLFERAGGGRRAGVPGGQDDLERANTDYRPPERGVTEMDLGGATLRCIWTFEDVEDGRTRLTQQMTLEGPSGQQYAADLDAVFSQTIGTGMEKIALAMAASNAS